MKYRVLGRSSGLRVSQIAQGGARGGHNNSHAALTDEDVNRPHLVSVT